MRLATFATVPVNRVCMAVKPVSKGEPPTCACAASGVSRRSRKNVFERRNARKCLDHAGEKFIRTSDSVDSTCDEQVMGKRLALMPLFCPSPFLFRLMLCG